MTAIKEGNQRRLLFAEESRSARELDFIGVFETTIGLYVVRFELERNIQGMLAKYYVLCVILRLGYLFFVFFLCLSAK